MLVADYENWFAGLKALSRDEFPKHCACCGRIYRTEEEYFRETRSLRDGRTGLKHAEDDDAASMVELYRNCVCGSTLMAYFSDRRDQSPAGLKRRQLFDELRAFLEKTGMQHELAHAELLKVMHGETSETLESWYAHNLARAAQRAGDARPGSGTTDTPK